MLRVTCIALTAALLAGCVSDAEPETPEPLVPVANDATGCTIVAAGVVRPPEMLQQFLPDGYTVADASTVFGLPVPTGMAMALVSTYSCEHASMTNGPFAAGEVNIAIEDPGKAPGSADFHYYLAEVYAPEGPLYDTLARDGWTVLRVDDATIMLGGSGIVTASGQVGNGTGAGYQIDVLAAAPTTLAGTERFWHETPSGPSFFEYVVSADALAGAGNFAATGGHLAAKLGDIADLQATPLDPPGIVAPAVDWQATYYPPGTTDAHQAH